MSRTRLFGTDGIRGRAGEGVLSPASVSAIGRAVGQVLGSRTPDAARRRALLGHDGRRSGPGLLDALARGLSASGYEVVSAGLITTPGLALLGRLQEFDAALMVSASHNPAEDNGIKVFHGTGDKLADELEDEIEARLAADPSPVEEGPAPVLDGQLELAYLEHLTRACRSLKLHGLSLILDCANGGGSRVAPRVFGRLGAHVTAIAAEPDGDNINAGCGATSLEYLQGEVRRHGAQLGVALDGDGDRCMLVDEAGEIVNGDAILTLLALHAHREKKLPGGRIVATVMSNRGLHRALREEGIGVVTVDVGDRRVVEGLRREGLGLGGEQSGHVIFGGDNFHIGDGIYTALRVLRVLRATGLPLSELAASYRAFPQVLVNVRVTHKPSLRGIPAVAEAVQAVEEELGEDGRVLLRYSGTEDLARVMVEGADADWIGARAQELADLIAREIGARATSSTQP